MCLRLLLDIHGWPLALSCSSKPHALLLRQAPNSHRAGSQPFLQPCLFPSGKARRATAASPKQVLRFEGLTTPLFLMPLTPPLTLLHTCETKPFLICCKPQLASGADNTLQCGVARVLAWCYQVAGQCPATFPLTSLRGSKMR